MTQRIGALLGLGIGLSSLGFVRPAAATAGTHAPAVSTYDTRASSIVFAYRHGFSGAGSFNTFSYNANFTSTTGRLSAQFGIHYVNYAQQGIDATAHGVGGSGVAVLEYPLTDRYANGVPKLALALHLGGVPTAYISGERNFLTLPLVLGFGLPLSPAKMITFTPWYELALSTNVDTVVRPEGVTITSNDVVFDPTTGSVALKQGAVQDALSRGVTIDVGVSVPMRVGLEGAIHLGNSVDLNLYGMLSTLGGAFSGDAVTTTGAALVIRWDDIVPAVLPKPALDVHEACEATERRFRACPSSRHWLSPEQRGQINPPPSSQTPAALGSSPLAPAAPPSTQPAVPAAAPPPTAAPVPTPPPTAPPPASAPPGSSSSFPVQ
jgi:hypothetical protein